MVGSDESGHLLELVGKVGALTAQVGTLNRQWGARERDASETRRRMHEKIDGMRDEVSNLANRVTNAEAAITKMAPVVRAGEIAQLRSAGARQMLKVLWLSLTALFGAIVQAAFNLLPHRPG